MGKGEKVKREFSSGGVVFRKVKGELLWLIRKTAASDLIPQQHWMLAKGWLEPGEKSEETALREVKEETGIEAKIIKKIGTERYFYRHPQEGLILKFVTYFLMEYVRNLPEGFDEETAEIAWLPYPEAYRQLSFEKQVLKKADEILAKGVQVSLV